MLERWFERCDSLREVIELAETMLERTEFREGFLSRWIVHFGLPMSLSAETLERIGFVLEHESREDAVGSNMVASNTVAGYDPHARTPPHER